MMDWPSAEWVAAIATVVSLLFAMIWGVVTLRRDFEERRYADLDRLHFELLRMRVENPDLAPPKFSQKAGGASAEAAKRGYGCLVWSFIESVLDYCDRSERDFSAWAPAVAYESSAYESWLTPENLRRFEPNFPNRVKVLVGRYTARYGDAATSTSVERL